MSGVTRSCQHLSEAPPDMGEGGDNDSAQGARIEGKIDVVKTLLEASQRINDERHNRTTNDIDDLRNRVHRHGNELTLLVGLPPRVDNLEKAHTTNEGEKRGMVNTLKIAWMTGGAGVTAFVLAIARKAGLL